MRRDLSILAAVGLMGTVTVGAFLRWALAGVVLPCGEFGHVRHLHTHLGYYGALVPLMWAAWAERGERAPARGWVGLYALAVLLASVGFVREGYGLLAIVASGVVLFVWVVAAWGLRGRASGGGGWLAPVPVGIVFAALLIPLVAKAGPGPRAQELVRSFLGMLMFGAILPTALERAGAVRVPPFFWVVGATMGALSLGAVPGPALALGLAALGMALASVQGRSERPFLERAPWVVVALGLVLVGLSLVELSHALAVAGIHFLALGPLLLGLWPVPLPPARRVVVLALVGAMCAGIAAGSVWPQPWLPTAVAVCGTGVALAWASEAALLLWGARVRG